jgi:diaminopimelate epimerase
LTAYQVSERGGVLKVKVLEDHVLISGQAFTVFEGKLFIK